MVEGPLLLQKLTAHPPSLLIACRFCRTLENGIPVTKAKAAWTLSAILAQVRLKQETIL